MTTISEAYKTDRVYEAVKAGFSTNNEIAQEVGLNGDDVSKCLYSLTQKGKIEKVGTAAAVSGHPANVYRVKANGVPPTGLESKPLYVRPEQMVIMTRPGDGGGSGATVHKGVGQANSRQAGGDHYTKLPVQPWDVMEADFPREQFIGFLRGCLLKRIMRFGTKDGDPLTDIRKIIHEAQKLESII